MQNLGRRIYEWIMERLDEGYMRTTMVRIDRDRLARVAQGYTNDDPIIQDARYWLLDAFEHDEDAANYIETMSVFEVVLAVERNFDGGWDHFVELALPAQ